MYDDFGWRPYVPVAARKYKAEREMARMEKKGRKLSPVVVPGRKIASTFWGEAWCRNLESYSDYENRLPRGRAYARHGAVLDLQIAAGNVSALVSGTRLYTVGIGVSPVPKSRWRSICRECAGTIDSLIELLQGRFSKAVMDRICRQRIGLFPSPGEIRLSCSCPDWATMCKHVAAVLYGVGARLDEQPELLFRLRQVDQKDLITQADGGLRAGAGAGAARTGKVLAGADLEQLFGLEMGGLPNARGGGAAKAGVRKTGRRGGAVRRKGKAVAAGKTSVGSKKKTRDGAKRGPKRRSRATSRSGERARAKGKPTK